MKENAEKFKEFAEKNPELMEKLKAAKNMDEVIAIASENGFNIEESDLVPDADEEISLDDLEAVSGGNEQYVEFCNESGQLACYSAGFRFAEW